MHRTVQLTVSPDYTDTLLRELEKIEEVIGLSASRGASLKPRGDVITVNALNRGVDDVLKVARDAQRYGPISFTTAEIASLIDPGRQEEIESDIDEAIWEEMETGLRHQGRVSPNYVALMALGGVIAATGVVSEGVSQSIAFVSASIIAPGFEPIAKVPIGVVLRRWNVARRGLISMLVGYAVLVATATLTTWLMSALGVVDAGKVMGNKEVGHIANPGPIELLVSAAAAAAGMIMIAAYRRSVIAGPLIALVLIPAAALMGVSIALAQPGVALQALGRLGLDILLIIVLGAAIIAAKQLGFHRRKPTV